MNIFKASYNGNIEELKRFIEIGENLNLKNSSGDAPLHEIVRGDKREALALLLENGADINILNKASMTPFHLAVLNRRYGIALYLLEKGADFEKKTPDGRSPLHIMAESPFVSPELVKKMKEHGADLNIIDFVRYTPLHICAQKNNIRMAEVLLELGADPCLTAIDGNMPIHLYVQDAFESMDAEMIKLLVKYGSDINEPGANGDFPVHIASRWNKPVSFKVLIEMGADSKIKDRQGRDAFDIAKEYNNQEILEIIGNNKVLPGIFDDISESVIKPETSIINRKDSSGSTLLAKAIRKKDVKMMKFLLENGANPDLNIGDGSKPLHIVCSCGNADMIKMLLEHGVCIDSKNGAEMNPLQIALRSKNIETAKFLIEAGADIHSAYFDGLAPIHLAGKINSYDLINLLAKAGCDIYRRTRDGKNPLIIAIENNATETAIALIDNGADIKIGCDDEMSVLGRLCILKVDGREKILQKLIDKGVDLNKTDKSGNTLLHLAYNCDADFIKILLDKGANINARNYRLETPLYNFISNGYNNTESILFLISKGANINEVDGAKNSALHLLCNHSCDPQSFSKILNGPVNVNKQNLQGETALHKAVKAVQFIKSLEIIKFLLKAGADPNIKDLTGETALHKALFAKSEILKILLDAGANPDIENNYGCSVIESAELNNKNEALKILLRYSRNSAPSLSRERDSNGYLEIHRAVLNDNIAWFDSFCKQSNLELRDRNHMTPLHLAVLNNKIKCLKKLIEMKADINAKTDQGITPLHLAVSKENSEIIKILLENDAQVNARDIHGETPIFKGVQKNNIDLVKMLFKAGASVNIRSIKGGLIHEASKFMDDINFFLELNLDINEKDSEGNTPLCILKKYNKQHNIQLLLDRGAKPEKQSQDFNYVEEPGLVFGPDGSNERGMTFLHNASEKGDIENITDLIKNGADINKRNIEGRTPLHCAAKYNDIYAYNGSMKNPHYNIETCRTLLAFGADINARDTYGMTPLFLSIDCPDEELMKFLLEKGADINAVDNYGNTVLISSLGSLKEDKAIFLLNRKADHSIINYKGKSAWDIVIEHKSFWRKYHDLIRLMDGGKKKEETLKVYDYSNMSLAEILIEENNLYLLDRLLEYDIGMLKYDEKGRNVIHYSVLSDNLNLLKYFAHKGFDINAFDKSGKTPLSLAIVKNRPTMVEQLIECGADINYVVEGGKPPIIEAFMLQDLQIARYLIEQGADLNSKYQGKSSLMYAVEKLTIGELSKYFSAKDIDFNTKDSQNSNALFYTLNYDIIKFLMKNGCDINCSNKEGITPLLQYCRRGSIDIVKLLLENGADIHSRSNTGFSAVHYAIVLERLDLVQLLAENGALIDSPDNKGDQPIHKTVTLSGKSRLLIMKYLLDMGANIDAKNNNGKTPLIMSVKRKSLEAVKLLLDKGASTKIKDNNGNSAEELMGRADYLAMEKAEIENLRKFDSQGMTPLLKMAKEGNLFEVQRLISLGADVNWNDSDGSNALHWAVVSNSGSEIIEFLISCNTSVNKEDINGQTPLHIAAQAGNADACRILAKDNDLINKRNKLGLTALHWASALGYEIIVKILLENDAKTDICTKLGKTALELAKDARKESEKTAIDLTKDSIYYNIIKMLEEPWKYKKKIDAKSTQPEVKIKNSSKPVPEKKSIWKRLFGRKD